MYYVEKSRGISFFKRFDYLLILSVISLSLIGIYVLPKATMNMAGSSRIMFIQILSIGLGIVVAVVISVINYSVFKTIGGILYAVSIVLLIYVLFGGYGREELGSKSWLLLPGGISVQPSEIAKITYILYLSVFLERMKQEYESRDLIKFLFFSLIPIALVLLQPDYGMAVVFIFILFVMLFVWGLKYRYIILTAGFFMLTAPFVWIFALNEERKERIIAFLLPGMDPSDANYQVEQAKMAMRSGGLRGNLGGGTDSHLSSSVPVSESDFIFTVIGETLGFLGSSIVILLVVVVVLKSLSILANSRDYYGEYITAGVMGMFVFQFFENIGMNIGLLPVTGLPLPFVSAGGSAMITNYIAVGIVLSVSLRKKKKMFDGR